MANLDIPDLPELLAGDLDAANDELLVEDVSAGETKRIKASALGASDAVLKDGSVPMEADLPLGGNDITGVGAVEGVSAAASSGDDGDDLLIDAGAGDGAGTPGSIGIGTQRDSPITLGRTAFGHVIVDNALTFNSGATQVFRASSSEVRVQTTLTPNVDSTYDIGTSSAAWANLYVDTARAAVLRALTDAGDLDVGPVGAGALRLGANSSTKMTVESGGITVNTSSMADASSRQVIPGEPRTVGSGTSTTAAITDHGRGIDITSTAGAHTLTVPSLAAGTIIPVSRRTTSTVTLSASGVSLNYDTGTFAGTIATSGTIVLHYLTSTTVRVVGALDLV